MLMASPASALMPFTGRTTVVRILTASVMSLVLAGSALAADGGKPLYTFGTLRTATADAAKGKAKAWLESVAKYDAAAFDAIWKNESRRVFERTLDALMLGSTAAKAALHPCCRP